MFQNKSILVTGGTGSFGKAFIRRLLESSDIPEAHRHLLSRRAKTVRDELRPDVF